MPRQDFTPPPPRHGFIGHRGIAALAPENTLASFMLAKSRGIDWVEFDLRLTKDHQLVIFHDETLERTTNGKGFVHHHTLASLSTLDAGSWFDARFNGEKILPFVEALPELISLKLYLNIELKIPTQATQSHQRALTTTLIDILLTYWPKTTPWPLISSFHWELLWELIKHIPQVPIGFLSEKCTSDLIELVAKTPNAALICHYQNLDDLSLETALSKEIPVLAYTINEPAIARKLLQAGIYGIISDNPTLLSIGMGVLRCPPLS